MTTKANILFMRSLTFIMHFASPFRPRPQKKTINKIVYYSFSNRLRNSDRDEIFLDQDGNPTKSTFTGILASTYHF
jgi:hypothetical protein